MTLGIASQKAAGSGQRLVMTESGEDVAKLALFRGGVADAIGGEQGKT